MNNKIFIKENLHKHVGQFFNFNKIIYDKKSKFQHIQIFNNKILGRILLIDNTIQTTYYDEHIYHEMLCIVPINSHPNPKNILIIGGGDGGCLKQIIKFKNIKKIYLVEIDEKIIKCSKKYLYKIHKNSFNDKRVKIIIKNGIKFLEDNEIKFDIIIIDGTDPIGPGKILFKTKFYHLCKKSLNKNGIFVSQNGTYIQKKYSINTYYKFKKIFKYKGFYTANIPTYYGGIMLFLWGSENINIKKTKIKTKNNNFKYYNKYIHTSSFYLPENINKKINL